MFTLRMTSSEYGTEEFEYTSLTEAQEGYRRIIAKIDDDIEREFEIVEIHERFTCTGATIHSDEAIIL